MKFSFRWARSSRGGDRACVIFNASFLILLLRATSYFEKVAVNGFQITPGMGLCSNSGKTDSNANDGVEIVIFEHTDMGTGGLVYNCPTPLCMGNLPIPRFEHYKELPLMLGCGMDDNNNDGIDDEYCVEAESTVVLSEVAPWFWLHNIPNVTGSYELAGASGPLYMGGNIDEATNCLKQNDNSDPKGRIKFFRKYKVWQKGQLEQELQQGKWIPSPQDPIKALHPTMPLIKL